MLYFPKRDFTMSQTSRNAVSVNHQEHKEEPTILYPGEIHIE